MALSGLHVVCANSGSNSNIYGAKLPLLYNPRWSETLALGSMTTHPAPEEGLLFHITAGSAECYFAVGPSPDSTQTVSTTASNSRIHLYASESIDVYVRSGDKLHCSAA